MAVRKVNLVSCRLEEEVDEHGFRHTETVVGPAIGAQRIGASVYEGVAGHPIWPYHYHYGVEEWLYVVSGAPVLRDPGGRRTLRGGDIVCFPAGYLGAHTLEGPGRFVIFSTGVEPPTVAVYPDSDKLAAAPLGPDQGDTDFMVVRRDASVEYWSGEGTQERFEPASVVRQPDVSPSPPVLSALEVSGQLGASLGASLLDAAALDLNPGQVSEPYHYSYGREEWVLLLDGKLTLRHPAGEEELVAGEVVCFPEGPAGAHALENRSDSLARAMFLSTTRLPANACYPDAGTWLIRNAPGADGVWLEARSGSTVR